MEIPSFLLPAHHTLTGYLARRLADSKIGNFSTEERTNVKIAIFAARFFAQPLLWAAAIVDITASLYLILLTPCCIVISYPLKGCSRLADGLYKTYLVLWKCLLKVHMPHTITLLLLPITALICAIDGKIIPVKVKKVIFKPSYEMDSPMQLLLDSELSMMKDQDIAESFARDNDPEEFTQLLAELSIEERMKTVSFLFARDHARALPLSTDPASNQYYLERDEARRKIFVVEVNFTHRFASRDAIRIRQLPRMHRLGIPINITSMRIFQKMMQLKNGNIGEVAKYKNFIISKGEIDQQEIETALNPCVVSRFLYERECQVRQMDAGQAFSPQEIDLAIDRIKEESSYILRKSLPLPRAIHPIIRDYMIGEDLHLHLKEYIYPA